MANTLDLLKQAPLADVDRLEYVCSQVYRLEEETAQSLLEYHDLPSDPLAVRRFVYGRMLFMTLRLREHAL